MIVDFRKTIGTKAWSIHRPDHVDINNIKSAFHIMYKQIH